MLWLYGDCKHNKCMCFLNNNPYASPHFEVLNLFCRVFPEPFQFTNWPVAPESRHGLSQCWGQRPGSLRSASELPPISLCFRDLTPFPECPPHLSPKKWGHSITITLKTTDLGKLKALVIVGTQEDTQLSVCQQLSWDHTVEVRQFIDQPLVL